VKKLHLEAQAAYEGAKSQAAKALADYNAAVKAHCDAEAVHAAAVEYIGHGQFKKDECKKYASQNMLAEAPEKCSQGWPVDLGNTHAQHKRTRKVKSLQACKELVKASGASTPAYSWAKGRGDCDYWPGMPLSKGKPDQKTCCSYWTTCYGNGKSVGEL